MYDQPKQQYAGNAINQAPAPTRQVEGALDSANFALDTLENTVRELIRRLEPVTGGYPETGDDGLCASSPLVPIAARISYISSRIGKLNESAERALNALEI